jgi:hypothetical protein
MALLLSLALPYNWKRKTMPENQRKPISSFGEVLCANPSPRVQIDATYGIRASDIIQTAENSATIEAEMTGTGFEFKLSSGTNAAGYARMQSRRIVRYKAGQGSLFRFTGRFPASAANSLQRVGCGNRGTHFGFGYKDTEFGIFYHNGGFVEIRTLTITAAPVGNQNVTITLNGTAFVVAVTAGTIKHAVFELAAATYSGWEVYGNGTTLVFVARHTGPRAGTYSLTATGTVTGTFAQTRAGVEVNKTFIPQSEWSIDRMDGTTASGIVLDPSKGNVFEIQQQYLGYGAILFSVENPGHGKFMEVHRIEYANANTSPNMTAPYMRMEIEIENSGNTTNLSVYSASMAGFVEGEERPLRDLRGFGNSKAAVGTSFTSIIAFRCSRIFASRVNRSPCWPHIVSFSCEGNKPVECICVVNPTFAGEPDWTYLDSADSIMEYDTAATTVTGGRRVAQFVLGKSDNLQVVMPDHHGHTCIDTGEVFVLAARATSGTSDISASLSWEEE